MSGGYWAKGNNPFTNFDFDAATRDKENHRIRGEAHQQKLDNELQMKKHAFELQKIEQESSADLSKMRIRMNATIASHNNEIKAYEQRLNSMTLGLYNLAIRSNTFYRTLVKLQEKWPDKKEDILDEIQTQRDYCVSAEYRQQWWDWANNFKKTPNDNDEYFNFPFAKRQVRKP